MKHFEIKKPKGRGEGLFATRSIKKGEIILNIDPSKLKRYSLKEIAERDC